MVDLKRVRRLGRKYRRWLALLAAVIIFVSGIYYGFIPKNVSETLAGIAFFAVVGWIIFRKPTPQPTRRNPRDADFADRAELKRRGTIDEG